MTTPTLSQQRALAYAPKPLALISVFASLFTIHHLIVRKRHKLSRMYHRLILAMSVTIVPQSVSWIWGSWAIPEGTPNFVGASGTVQTCTAQGFMNAMFSLTVVAYYASLGIYSFLAIKNNFREEKYKFAEVWIHAVAYLYPLGVCILVAAKEGFNPRGTGCFIAADPLYCDTDPQVECVRGGELMDMFIFLEIFLGGFQLVCFIIPLLAMLFVGHWIRMAKREAETNMGLRQIQASVKKQMLRDVLKQMGIYLISFWTVSVCPVANVFYKRSNGHVDVTLLIVGNCITSLQGVIITIVYFALQRMSNRTKEVSMANIRSHDSSEKRKKHLTISKIRINAELEQDTMEETYDEQYNVDDSRIVFSIFDGSPTEDSPWANYIDTEDYDGRDDSNQG